MLACLILFAWAGMKVHDTVLQLNTLSQGVQDAGTAVNGGFSDVAGAVGSLPIVGSTLADSLKNAGQATGGNVVKAGLAGETAVNDTATVLGWVTFLLPGIVLLVLVIPLRVRQIIRLTDAARHLGPVIGPERQRLLAMRAAFGLPWAALENYSQDPMSDLEAGHFDPLVEALYADVGLRPPALAAPGG